MLRIRDEFRRGQVAVGSLFLLLGFQYATWVSRLPAIKARLGLSDAEVGLLLMVCGVGAAASFPLVAALMKWLGSRGLCVASAALLGLLPLALGVAPDYAVALIIVCCDGVGVACLDVAMNAQGTELEERFDRKAMGKLHATFSAGSLCGALLASAVNAATSDVSVHFGVAAILILALLAYAQRDLLTPLPQAEPMPEAAAPEVAENAPSSPKKRAFGIPLPTRLTLWLGLAMAFGTIVEGAMNDWSALYLKNVAKAAAGLTPMGIAVFSIAMVLARVFSDSWRKRWGDGPVVVLGSAFAGLGLATGVLVGGVFPALLGFACVGLGIAAVTPCVYVAAAGAGTDALALVAAMGTVGLLAGPGLIGLIASGAGLAWGMGAVALAAAAVAACTTRIAWTPRPTAVPTSPVLAVVDIES
ncbi:MFS transporter [Actinospica sp. MGRD01-02]|uniref:MFS transporter n=1 Tax=Actinospica acidithermotolerans TaxID=2828514 RepID=A0A941IKN2_9ACTN|nr:MFS transporter [Actinospica acidithermotolerans]MBR7829107.1 MFS transporter [Actinospica acidithermotolerans]